MIADLDGRHVWHPFTQARLSPPAEPIARAEGALLFTEDGRSYIDAISSWWVNLHGHCHPRIVSAIAGQAARLDQVIFAGFTHQPAALLAARLAERLPGALSRIFYSDDGSTSVEVAIKMALQYWHNRGEKRRRLIALESAYHGDTFGAMSSGDRSAFSAPFDDFLFEVERVPLPSPGREELCFEALERAASRGDAAALIFEPLVLGAGGMLMYEAAALERMMAICRARGVLTIADEVMTGFFRTGRMFACDRLENPPDIMCLSKGITGGVLPLGATACTEAVYEAFLSDDRRKTFFHGHSYTANPLACAAALASLDLLEEEGTRRSIERIVARHEEAGALLRQNGRARRVRQCGTILALDFGSPDGTSYFNALRDKLYPFFLSRGVLLRPLGNVVYVLPPYCTTDAQLEQIYGAVLRALEEVA